MLELLGWCADRRKVKTELWRKADIASPDRNTEEQRQGKNHAAGKEFVQGWGKLAEGAVIFFCAKNTVRMSRFQNGNEQQCCRQGNQPPAATLG